jgi:predicted nucleotidyltransferase
MKGLDGLNPDFRDILIALADADAEFLVVGAYAVSFHGHARTTGDIDLFVRPDPQNAQKVWQALVDFGAPVAAIGVKVEDFAKPDMVIQIGVPPRRIDLLTGVSGVSFDDAWSSRVDLEWQGRRVAVLGLEQLLRNKRATGRTRDLLDVEALEKLRDDE